MEEALNKFFSVTANPYSSLSEWKEHNERKIVGCFPMHIPEEIIHAAGMLPVVIWRGDEPVTLGHAHVPPFNCGLTRSFVDDAVRDKLDFLDGMVIYRMCLQAQGLPFILERNARPSYLEYLYLPALFPGQSIKAFLMQELERLKAGVEEYGGQKITTQSLNQSISVYNKNRGLLRKLYQLRRDKPGVLRAKEMLAIVHSSMLMPKEEHNQLLEKLLPQLETRQPPGDKGIKVVLSGSLCQTPRTDILDLIEELGMVVVDDDMYIGSRYFANDVELGDKPIESLADRYLERTPPCPTKGDWETDWSDYLVDMANKNQARGIINLMVKFCPPHLCYYPDIKRKLSQAGIPEVLIEVEHEAVSLERVRTGLQTFAEIAGGR